MALCVENPSVTGGFFLQKASNLESVSLSYTMMHNYDIDSFEVAYNQLSEIV